MKRTYKTALVLLRIAMGWLFFYSGLTKILNPDWTAEGYLKGAKTLPALYSWFGQPGILPITDLLNEWGQLLLGASLIMGAFVTLGASLGILLMILYRLPLGLLYPDAHSFIIDMHVIYALALLLIVFSSAGEIWGLDKFIFKKRHEGR